MQSKRYSQHCMIARFFFLLLLMAAAELYVLFRVATWIGPIFTIAATLCTALGGVTLARIQGFHLLRKWQQAIQTRQRPDEGVMAGAALWLGGVLLFIPGFISDAFGLLLVLPWTRRALIRYGAKRFSGTSRTTVYVYSDSSRADTRARATIDTEAQRLKE